MLQRAGAARSANASSKGVFFLPRREPFCLEREDGKAEP